MKRHMFAAGFIALASSLALGAWSGSATHTNGKDPCDCATIPGEVGTLVDFSTTNSPSDTLKTTGKVGAKWNGERYPLCGGTQVIKNNDITHTWTRTSGTASGVCLLSQLTTLTATGSAEQLDPTDPSWWWDTSATIVEHKPTMQYWDPNVGNWISAPYFTVRDTQANGGGADNPNNNQPPVPPSTKGTSTLGMTPGSTTAGDTYFVYAFDGTPTKIKCYSKFTSTGGPPSGDNCKVLNEKLELDVTEFKTKVTEM